MHSPASCRFGRGHARLCPDRLHVECWVWPPFCRCDEPCPQLPGWEHMGKLDLCPSSAAWTGWPLLTSARGQASLALLGGFAALVLFCLGSSRLPGGAPRVQGRLGPQVKECGSLQGGLGSLLGGSLNVPGVKYVSLTQRHLPPFPKATVRVKCGTCWRSKSYCSF